MNKNNIVLSVSALGLIAAGAYIVHGNRLADRVSHLRGEAHSRGIYTTRHYLSGTDQGVAVAARLYGIDRLSDLRLLEVSPVNVSKARTLLASVEPYFEPIEDFAALDTYTRRRLFEDPRSFDDISPISAAAHAEGWRGYLLAVDGEFDAALSAANNLKGFMERTQDERFPIGTAIAGRAQDRISKILLKLADSATSAEIDRLLASAKTIPDIAYKESFAAGVAGALEDIDNYENGKYQVEPPRRIFGLRFYFDRTASYYDGIRADVLEHAIKLHDNWDTVEMDMLIDNSLDLTDLDIGEGIVSSYAMTGVGQLKSERNNIANRRALLLTLAAYKHRLEEGSFPSIGQLEAKGYNAVDPWGHKKMTLNEDGNRIWVGGLRKNRKALSPAPLEQTEILEWRP